MESSSTRRSSRSRKPIIDFEDEDDEEGLRRSTRNRKKRSFGDEFAYNETDARNGTSTRSTRRSSSTGGYPTRGRQNYHDDEEEFETALFSTSKRPTRRAKTNRVHYEEPDDEEIIEEPIKRPRKRTRVADAKAANQTPPKGVSEEQSVGQGEQIEPAAQNENQLQENQDVPPPLPPIEGDVIDTIEDEPAETPKGRKKDADEDGDYVQSANEEEEEEISEDDIIDLEDDDGDEDDSPQRLPRTANRRRHVRRGAPSGRYNLRGKHGSDSEGSSTSGGEPIKKRLRPRTDIQRQPYTAPSRSAPMSVRNIDRRSQPRNQVVHQLQNMDLIHLRQPRRHDDSSSSSSSDSDSDGGMSVIRSRASSSSGSQAPYADIAPLNANALKKKKKNEHADIDPIAHDKNITWDSIGGLAHHIEALKEMILLPLLYPSYFEKFQIAPPRGVIFYGPPGTGKTLVARALAGACTSNGQPIAFFMRKGADILSKWVGEAEKQLRLLFDRAKELQPSIIFFDEIDGLAPVRSSKQDYIHSSIVSTLLALMDGLDNRGQVVVIGATNRIDAIDPALRRPGRFDRELAFTLPNMEARKEILRIHTKNWKPQPEAEMIESICRMCVGYCGADIKALVTEAALYALKRKFPQIYSSTAKLNIDLDSVQVTRMDFLHMMKQIIPAAHRHAIVHSQPLPSHLSPVLLPHLDQLKQHIKKIFPASTHHLEPDTNAGRYGDMSDDQNVNILSSMSDYYLNPPAYRPWLLICGNKGMGQQYLGQALLYALEAFPVYSLGLASLFSNVNYRGTEETLVSTLAEARKHAPSIVFVPEIDEWWKNATDMMKSTLTTMLQNLRSSLPVLVIATSNTSNESQFDDEEILSEQVTTLFKEHVYLATRPTPEQIRTLFAVVKVDIKRPPLKHVTRTQTVVVDPLVPTVVVEELPIDPVAPAPQIIDVDHEREERKKRREQLANAEKVIRKQERPALMELRLHLRDIMIKITNQNIYQVFTAPRSDSAIGSGANRLIYLSDMVKRLENGYYTSLKLFLHDIGLISANAELYIGGGTNETVVTNSFDQQGDINLGDTSNLTTKEVEKRMNVVMRGRQLAEAVQTVASQLINADLVRTCKSITRRRKKYEKKMKAREEEDERFIASLLPPAPEVEQNADGEKPQEEQIVIQDDDAPVEKENEDTQMDVGEKQDAHVESATVEQDKQDASVEQEKEAPVEKANDDMQVDENKPNEAQEIVVQEDVRVIPIPTPPVENDAPKTVEQVVVNEELEIVDTTQQVEINEYRLEKWFENLVSQCSQLNVDQLDKIFSGIYQHIFQYRFNAQRDELLEELETMLENL